MKVLKILAVVFGALLVLTGAGLLVGAALASTGQNVVNTEIAKSGFTGPVDGVVVEVEQGTLVTATFSDEQGAAHTGQGVAAGGATPKVGDTVSLYYSSDDPEQIVIFDVPGGILTSLGGTLRTAGIVCLIVGGLLLVGGIVGLVTGKKAAPALPAGVYPGGSSNQPRPGYPGQPYGQQPPPPYGTQPPPPGTQPPPYGTQPPPYGNQPPPYGTQPPPYGNQPPPGSQPPPYGNQPPPYGNQPPPPSDPPPGG